MPIYAYRCEACGHTQDILQKMADPVRTQCPSCLSETFKKQLTAAGFQLKGSGWYATKAALQLQHLPKKHPQPMKAPPHQALPQLHRLHRLPHPKPMRVIAAHSE
jgi:putative FmdB family regulatory protein